MLTRAGNVLASLRHSGNHETDESITTGSPLQCSPGRSEGHYHAYLPWNSQSAARSIQGRTAHGFRL